MIIFIKTINRFLSYIVILLYASIVVIIFCNVILRYGFGSSLGPWTTELTSFFLVWITFLASVILLEEEGHFQVPIIVDEKIKATKIRLIINTFARGLMICFFISTILSSKVFLKISSYALTFRLRKIYVYAVVPLAFFMFAIILFNKIYQEYKKFR